MGKNGADEKSLWGRDRMVEGRGSGKQGGKLDGGEVGVKGQPMVEECEDRGI